MITWARAPQPGVDAHAKPEGNATDLRYLEDAVAALVPIMAVCAGATRSSRPDVRALARDALSVQARPLRGDLSRPARLGAAREGASSDRARRGLSTGWAGRRWTGCSWTD